MCGFDRVWKGKYFGGEPIIGSEVEIRVEKLKSRKAVTKDEVTRGMTKGGVTGCWAGFGACVIWPLRVVLCLKTRDLR